MIENQIKYIDKPSVKFNTLTHLASNVSVFKMTHRLT